MRKIYAEILVDDNRAIEEDLGTIDYLEKEISYAEQKGIIVYDSVIADEDDESEWARYTNYLMNWAMSHTDEEYKGMSPACFDEWRENEDI